jgi:hypothetical protein
LESVGNFWCTGQIRCSESRENLEEWVTLDFEQ